MPKRILKYSELSPIKNRCFKKSLKKSNVFCFEQISLDLKNLNAVFPSISPMPQKALPSALIKVAVSLLDQNKLSPLTGPSCNKHNTSKYGGL